MKHFKHDIIKDFSGDHRGAGGAWKATRRAKAKRNQRDDRKDKEMTTKEMIKVMQAYEAGDILNFFSGLKGE